MSVKSTTLENLILKTETWDPRQSKSNHVINYIDIGAIDSSQKTIVAAKEIRCHEAPSRARQKVRHGDVLISTVRPNLNAVAMVPKHLDGATASTGFCVLRANPKDLDNKYLLYFSMSPLFVRYLIKNSTGANYPAVSNRIVVNAEIPVPPIPAQKRISDQMAQLMRAKIKRLETLVQLDSYLCSLFIEMFSNSDVSKSWPLVKVEDLAAKIPNSLRTGPFGSDLKHSEFVNEGIAVLGIDNVVSNEFRWGERRFITSEKYEKLKRYTIRSSDILITIMGTVGRSCVVPDDIPVAINTKHLAAITLDQTKTLPTFLSKALLFHPEITNQLKRSEKGAIMAGLNLGIIKSLVFRLPPIELQMEFVRKCSNAEKLRASMNQSAYELDQLFQSLLAESFQ